MEARTAETRKGATSGVTLAQFREAERGLRLMLAKKFSAVWITEHASDILSQANTEYAEWLTDNPPARNPVGWLLNCAYWRAQNLLDSETRKPRSAPLDAVFHLADESTPSPEQQALDNDRHKRLREALSHLPDKERKLLSLVYFTDMSVREAGRRLGWGKSAADRHHRAAMKKMLALVGDRKLLSPAILGPAAWAAVNGEGQRGMRAALDAALDPVREGIALGSEALEASSHRLGELGRRLSPFADAGNAVAASGGGRALGYCAATAGVVVCGLVGTGAVGPGASALLPDSPRPQKSRPVRAQPASNPAPTPKSPAPELSLRERSTRPEAPKASEPAQAATTARRARDPHIRFPRASGKQAASEFGDNNFVPGSSTPAPDPPAESESPPPPSGSGSKSSGSSGSGTPPASEFGL